MSAHTQKTKDFGAFTWTDICRPENDRLAEIAREHELDLFLVRDSLETGHLPKFERTPGYDFLILRAYTAGKDARTTNVNELSNKIAVFFNGRRVITIHRAEFGFLDGAAGPFADPQELVLYIVRHAIQTFAAPAEELATRIDRAEHELFVRESARISLRHLYYLKTEARICRKLLQLTQAAMTHVEAAPANRSALQDVHDQLVGQIMAFEEVAEDAGNLLNTFLSVNAQKNNDVIRLLTIFSVFFLPLTFIVGIYGMNFEFMPELKWPAGYLYSIGLMVAVSAVIFYWFKRKKIL